jgi:hypothetical protein
MEATAAVRERCRSALSLSNYGMRTVLQRLLPLASALALSFAAGSASAESGDGVGFGPVFAYSSDDTAHIGWELGAAWQYAPLLRFSLGGSYRVTGGDRRTLAYAHYLAFEPWFYIGGTLGLAADDRGDARGVYGLWEAAPMALGDRRIFSSGDQLLWAVSLSIGWRGFGSTHQIYLSPKLWRMRGWDFFS